MNKTYVKNFMQNLRAGDYVQGNLGLMKVVDINFSHYERITIQTVSVDDRGDKLSDEVYYIHGFTANHAAGATMVIQIQM